MPELPRIVITGVGLTSPNGDDLSSYRQNLLQGVSGVEPYQIRHVGETLAGVCHFDSNRYQKRKELRRGTRAGSIAIYCAREATKDAGLEPTHYGRSALASMSASPSMAMSRPRMRSMPSPSTTSTSRSGLTTTNPRTVANNPAGEVTLNTGLHGPAYCLGGACAAGNLGLIQAAQMLQLGEVDMALGGGVSESIHTFGIFASFMSQGALAKNDDPARASRPFDRDRNGIVVSEGGCLFTLERLDDAEERGAKIYGELVGHAINSDASDFVLPLAERQNRCMRMALEKAGMQPSDIDIVNTHATLDSPGRHPGVHGTLAGVWRQRTHAHQQHTKSFIGHTMGAAGALELAGNLPSFNDGVVHPTINVDNLDPDCEVRGLVLNSPKEIGQVDNILSLSFGMLGINSAVIIRRY